MQGGHEIPIRVKVVWCPEENLSIYITKVEEITYLVTGEYVDDSKETLKRLVCSGTVESHDDDDENEELGNTEDENYEQNEIIE